LVIEGYRHRARVRHAHEWRQRRWISSIDLNPDGIVGAQGEGVSRAWSDATLVKEDLRYPTIGISEIGALGPRQSSRRSGESESDARCALVVRFDYGINVKHSCAAGRDRLSGEGAARVRQQQRRFSRTNPDGIFLSQRTGGFPRRFRTLTGAIADVRRKETIFGILSGHQRLDWRWGAKPTSTSVIMAELAVMEFADAQGGGGVEI